MKVSLQLSVALILGVDVFASHETFSMGIARPAFRQTISKVSDVGVSNERDVFSPFGNYGDDEEFDFCENSAMTLENQGDYGKVSLCGLPPVVANLARGAFLRVASDISGGTPLETIKCQVTLSKQNALQCFRKIIDEGGVASLWAGTPARTIEGALLGAAFLVGSASTKKQVMKLTGSKTLSSLSGGVVGGVLQAVVMTPAGLVFTSLNANRGKKGFENDNAITVTKRILKEKGIAGMFIGGGPMAARQASNWASRGMFTEIARTNFKMSQYGILGEIGSGIIGGLGSCWNTPIETVRVNIHKDVSAGVTPKSFAGYCSDIYDEDGIPGLFRGVTPRGVQADRKSVV